MPVSKLDRPTKVPPPIIVPDTRSNFPLFDTLIIETPLPMETKSLYLGLFQILPPVLLSSEI